MLKWWQCPNDNRHVLEARPRWSENLYCKFCENTRAIFSDKAEIKLDVTMEAPPSTGPTRLHQFWNAQSEWSQATFGTDAERGPIGPLKHLAKEAQEAQDKPTDIMEFVDCLFLTFDASRRAGFTLDQITDAAFEKLEINKKRVYPKTTDMNAAVEHQREAGTSEGATELTQDFLGVAGPDPDELRREREVFGRCVAHIKSAETDCQCGICEALRARLAEVEREREEQKDAREFMEGQREIEAQRARNAEARVEELEKALRTYISTIRYQIYALENGGGVDHVLVALKSADTTIRAALEDKR